ncbi:hypothetical protein NMY22_g13086 [Coprinellus aureogranulatus]|nr:hypothetical protein NMY22_g13086 [Coprinellus aureogranulatus]
MPSKQVRHYGGNAITHESVFDLRDLASPVAFLPSSHFLSFPPLRLPTASLQPSRFSLALSPSPLDPTFTDVYFPIRERTRSVADQHANLGRTIESLIVEHLRKLGVEVKAHIKNVQNDAGKLAASVAKERETSTRLVGELANAVSMYKNTPMGLSAQGDPFLINQSVSLQLQRQILEENLLQKSIIIMQQSSAHFEAGIVRSIQSAWATNSQFRSSLSTTTSSLYFGLAEQMAKLEPEREWVSEERQRGERRRGGGPLSGARVHRVSRSKALESNSAPIREPRRPQDHHQRPFPHVSRSHRGPAYTRTGEARRGEARASEREREEYGACVRGGPIESQLRSWSQGDRGCEKERGRSSGVRTRLRAPMGLDWEKRLGAGLYLELKYSIVTLDSSVEASSTRRTHPRLDNKVQGSKQPWICARERTTRCVYDPNRPSRAANARSTTPCVPPTRRPLANANGLRWGAAIGDEVSWVLALQVRLDGIVVRLGSGWERAEGRRWVFGLGRDRKRTLEDAGTIIECLRAADKGMTASRDVPGSQDFVRRRHTKLRRRPEALANPHERERDARAPIGACERRRSLGSSCKRAHPRLQAARMNAALDLGSKAHERAFGPGTRLETRLPLGASSGHFTRHGEPHRRGFGGLGSRARFKAANSLGYGPESARLRASTTRIDPFVPPTHSLRCTAFVRADKCLPTRTDKDGEVGSGTRLKRIVGVGRSTRRVKERDVGLSGDRKRALEGAEMSMGKSYTRGSVDTGTTVSLDIPEGQDFVEPPYEAAMTTTNLEEITRKRSPGTQRVNDNDLGTITQGFGVIENERVVSRLRRVDEPLLSCKSKEGQDVWKQQYEAVAGLTEFGQHAEGMGGKSPMGVHSRELVQWVSRSPVGYLADSLRPCEGQERSIVTSSIPSKPKSLSSIEPSPPCEVDYIPSQYLGGFRAIATSVSVLWATKGAADSPLHLETNAQRFRTPEGTAACVYDADRVSRIDVALTSRRFPSKSSEGQDTSKTRYDLAKGVTDFVKTHGYREARASRGLYQDGFRGLVYEHKGYGHQPKILSGVRNFRPAKSTTSLPNTVSRDPNLVSFNFAPSESESSPSEVNYIPSQSFKIIISLHVTTTPVPTNRNKVGSPGYSGGKGG